VFSRLAIQRECMQRDGEEKKAEEKCLDLKRRVNRDGSNGIRDEERANKWHR
jgi:hypothetical protein